MKVKIFQILSSILLITILCISSVNAQQPFQPHQFFGTVTFTNGPAMDGLSVVAKIDGEAVASTTTKDGKYGYEPYIFYIRDPDNNRYNKTIYFFVNGNQANEEAVFYNGDSTRLDLTLNVPGPTPTTTTVARGGGGGGGGGGIPATTTTTTTTTTTLKPKGEANMDIVNLIIPPDVNANEPFELGVEVKNIGDVEGEDDILLALPEDWTTDKWGERVSLEPDETTIIYFTITPNEDPGEIAVGSSTDFEVSGEITPRVIGRPLSITGMFLTALASLGYLWMLLVIIVVLLIFLYSKRKYLGKKPYKYKHKPEK